MIVKRNFNLLKVLSYVWPGVLAATLLSLIGWGWFVQTGGKSLVIPFAPLGVMGTALAIFLGFRNNNAYARWWEARTAWGNILIMSRVLARQIGASIGNAQAVGKVDAQKLTHFQREMVLRQIAFAHALRLHLRNQTDWHTLQPLLSGDEYAALLARINKPNALLQTQSNRLKDGVRKEMLGAFDPISLEPSLVALNNQQGAVERLKTTPLPRQYEYFTRVFLWAFLILLPFSLLSLFNTIQTAWLTVPVSLVLGFVYTVVNETGAALENPFENTINDVPMTTLCNTIERDLRDMLGDTDLPPALSPQNGYLF